MGNSLSDLQSLSAPTTSLFLLILSLTICQIGATGRLERSALVQRESGPWIVRFKESHFHADVTKSINDLFVSKIRTTAQREETLGITHSYHHVLHGATVHGVTLEELLQVEGIDKVHPDLPRYKTETNWGLDRIDQKSLPLDNEPYYTNLDYHGNGVDLYIVDTGLDTTHNEFQDNGTGRIVANIFNAYGQNDKARTDGDGHGTHVAGSAAGNTIGVANGANLYGMKVLADDGGGFSSDIIAALDEVLSRHTSKSGARSVVNMSLGGACSSDYCKDDPELEAIDTLIDGGVVVVVAAGNEYCNACHSSPSAAVRAITVGASQINDTESEFSNFGQCVDVYAPGTDIVSACSSQLNGCTTSSYNVQSGTSMASPHAAGVAAQLLQKNASATPHAVFEAMSCDAVESTLQLGAFDTITKNLLIQVPKDDGSFGECDRGDGCKNSCSGNGLCAAAHTNSSHGSIEEICHCDGGYGLDDCSFHADVNWPNIPEGLECSSTEFNDATMKVTVTMTDDDGFGWDYASFGIVDPFTRNIQSFGYDAFCTEDTDDTTKSRFYCLKEGFYTFLVSEASPDEFSEHNGWSVCDLSGSGSYEGTFKVEYNSADDSWSCFEVSADQVTSSAPSEEPSLSPSAAPTQIPTALPTTTAEKAADEETGSDNSSDSPIVVIIVCTFVVGAMLGLIVGLALKFCTSSKDGARSPGGIFSQFSPRNPMRQAQVSPEPSPMPAGGIKV